MREYNGLKRAMSHAGCMVVILLAVGLAGCAHDAAKRADSTRQTPPMRAPDAKPLAPRPVPQLRTSDLDAQIRDDAPLRYVVKRGDTLWDIAGYYLRDPWYWPQLWNDNPDIANPHLIYPGDVLILTRGADGQPRLARSRTEHLSPQIREEPIDEAVATIPLDAIRAFLTGPRVVSQDTLDAAPYIVSFLDEHLVGGMGTTVYVRDAKTDAPSDYSVVRATGAYTDPETGEILGQEAVPVGELHIDEIDDVATGKITRSYREALTGDRLLPIEAQDLIHDFYPHAPATPVNGHIISVLDGVSAIGQYQVVTLDRGAADGLERGHVLNIYEAGRVVRDPVKGGQVQLPEVRSGRLLVFKTGDQVAFAVIMQAQRAVHVGDAVHSPAG